jgi:hypothetical protein
MILYHFTRMENVEAIQRESLRARSQATLDGSTILGTFYKPAVYLTDQPTHRRRKCVLSATGPAPYRRQAMAAVRYRRAACWVHDPPAVA